MSPDSCLTVDVEDEGDEEQGGEEGLPGQDLKLRITLVDLLSLSMTLHLRSKL